MTSLHDTTASSRNTRVLESAIESPSLNTRIEELMVRPTSWLRPSVVVHAHCDVPCGIYDPSEAVLAARTVARMVELIGKLPEGSTAFADRNTFARCVDVKEQYAEKVKHEVQVIWSDYFKPEHLTAIPNLHTKVWNLLKLAGKCKQGVDAEAAASLEDATKDFADMFWSTQKQARG
jgi:nickel superoxide dismutase